jgi:hypothetical protein
MNHLFFRLLTCFFFLVVSNGMLAQAYDTVRLSSLAIEKATTGWGIKGKDVSCMKNPIRLAGVEYNNGFGTRTIQCYRWN